MQAGRVHLQGDSPPRRLAVQFEARFANRLCRPGTDEVTWRDALITSPEPYAGQVRDITIGGPKGARFGPAKRQLQEGAP